jgi:uncharacterized membrane protein
MEMQRALLPFVIACALSWRGYARQSLTLSGSIAAFLIGFLTMASSTLCGVLLLAFYLLGTQATRVSSFQSYGLTSFS